MREKNTLLRIIVPLAAIALSAGVVATMIFRQPQTSPTPPDTEQTQPAQEQSTPAGDPSEPSSDEGPAEDPVDPATSDPPPAPVPPADARDLTNLRVETVTAAPAAPLGSLDPAIAKMQLRMEPRGAGIDVIAFSDIWETAKAKRQAEAYRAALDAGEQPPAPPDEALRYILQRGTTLRYGTGEAVIPVLGASQLRLSAAGFDWSDISKVPKVQLAGVPWREIAPGQFEINILNGHDEVIATIIRRFTLGDGFEIDLEQRVTNHSGQPLRMQWVQYGPGDLRKDRGAYMDRRRVRTGRLDETGQFPLSRDGASLMERSDAIKRVKKAVAGEAAQRRIWPTEDSIDASESLMWIATSNRYFALAMHPAVDGGAPSEMTVNRQIGTVLLLSNNEIAEDLDNTDLLTGVYSPIHEVVAGATLNLDVGIYAGPLDRHVLNDPPYADLALNGLILYQMSSCCAICTFQWLAHLLLGFLSLMHSVHIDWGIAIILLVVVVRTLLHPITKKTQINMQRFGKRMSAMKPELDKLKEKYGHDNKRMQQEQMRLMQEHGISPLQALGCLPMFLQTPIWIALYAMLYFVYDLRHTPAFYGLFQDITGGLWPFLSDLSAADHCLGEFDTPFRIFFWNITGLNVLPILMGVVFFVQQKYLTPPPSPTMTADQLRQQKMMKVMMVLMMPVLLYSAPSGLTLYILTSSLIGIVESRYVRSHLKDEDLAAKPKPKKKRKKLKDAQARAYAKALEARKEKARRKARGPEKTYKKRK